MAIRNQGRPLFPVADRSLYKDVWEWAAKTKDSLEGFFNSNKVVFGPNLISNGSFESDTSAGPIVGWDLYHLAGNTGTGTMTGDSVNAYVGTRCMRLSRTAAPIAQVTGPMRIASRYFRLTANRPYQIGAAAKLDNDGEAVDGFFMRAASLRAVPSGGRDFISTNAIAEGVEVLFFAETQRALSSRGWGTYSAVIIPNTNLFTSLQLINNTVTTMMIDDVVVRSIEFQ